MRQSFILRDKTGRVVSPVVTYDPVARVVSLSNPGTTSSWLDPGVFYTVTMPVPPGGDLNDGPRAIDLATLASPFELDFQAVAEAGTGGVDRPIDFCEDVLPIFQLRCSGSLCHAAPVASRLPAEGLILETPAGVANTALGRVSQESNVGGQAGLGLPAGRSFGVQMPIIDVGNPGNSWLMYKVLVARTRPVDKGLDAGVATCAGGSAPTPVFAATPAPYQEIGDDERARLAAFLTGNQMPYPLNLADDQPTPVSAQDDESSTLPMPFEELERVRAWIAQGAKVTECTRCPGGG